MFSYLSYTIQSHLPRGGTAHNRLGPVASVSNEETLHWHVHSLGKVIPQLGFTLTAKISHHEYENN